MSKNLYLLFLCLFVLNRIFSADLDSLKQKYINTKESKDRLSIAYEIGKQTLYKEPDTAAKYLFYALKDSLKYSTSSEFANCLNINGVHYFMQSQYDSAIMYYTRALNMFLQIKDTASSIKSRKNIGLAKRNLGDYKYALKEFFIILDYYKSEEDSNSIAAQLNDIGTTYAYLGDFDEAINYQFEALSYLKNISNYRIEGSIYNSLGYLYNKQKKKDLAYAYYDKNLSLQLKGGNIYKIINSRNNLCTQIDYKTKPKECEDCLLKLLEDQRKINDRKGIARTYLNLSVQYRFNNECEKAIQCLDSTAYYLRFANDIFLKEKYFNRKAITLYECRNYKLAYNYYDSLILIRDSVFEIEKRKELLELDTKYQTKQKTENIKRLEAEKQLVSIKVQNQRLQIIILAIILIVFAIGGILFFYYQKQKQEKQRQLALIKMREEERVRIARDMHDDLGSGLTRISLLSEQIIYRKPAPQKEIKKVFIKITDQSRNLSKNLKEIIWAIDPSNDKFSEMLYYFRDYIYEFSSNSNLECKILFPETDIDFEVSSEIRRNIFLSLKEMLNNVAKYAEATELEIEFILKNKLGFLSVKDNGKGFDMKLVKKGVGLDSITARTNKLGGILTINTNPGEGTQIELQNIQLNTTKM